MCISCQIHWFVETLRAIQILTHKTDSKLVEDPTACAGVTGTTITAEDLFYNVATRRKALKSASDEHQRIVDLITRYALHNSGVAFTLRKAGENVPAVQTMSGATVVDNVRALYGAAIGRELISGTLKDDALKFEADFHVTGPNHQAKRMTMVLFVNNRLVSSQALKRALDAVYQAYLPSGTHPFALIRLKVDTESVDVNVHPTKEEVHILNEAAVIAALQKAVDQRLAAQNASRTFTTTQTLLPGARPVASNNVTPAKRKEDAVVSSSSSTVIGLGAFQDAASGTAMQARGVRPDQMVRNDPSMQTLDTLFAKRRSIEPRAVAASTPVAAAQPIDIDDPIEEDVEGEAPPVIDVPPFVEAPEEATMLEDDVGASQIAPLDDAVDADAADTAAVAPESPHVHVSPPSSPLPLPREAAATTTARPIVVATTTTAAATTTTVTPARQSILSLLRTTSVPTPPSTQQSQSVGSTSTSKRAPTTAATPSSARRYTTSRLTSIQNLLDDVTAQTNEGLLNVTRGATLVGSLNQRLQLWQHQTQLFVVDVCSVTNELFYQLVLQRFAQFARMRLTAGAVPLKPLMVCALTESKFGRAAYVESDGSHEEVGAKLAQCLIDRRDMLSEYFALDIDEHAALASLPVVLEHYVPDLDLIPLLLLRLASSVDWMSEQECFRTAARELADFYCLQPTDDGESGEWLDEPAPGASAAVVEAFAAQAKRREAMEHVLFPAVKRHLKPSARMVSDGTFVNVASLDKLYKVFERC
jgi:DNA mismatch repair protein MLH1